MRRRTPTVNELRHAREVHEKNEARDLFYRAAMELVELVMEKESSLTLGEALAVLLQTWNKAYYQFSPFDIGHLRDIESLVSSTKYGLAQFRQRSIESLTEADEATLVELFQKYEMVLGPAYSNGDTG